MNEYQRLLTNCITDIEYLSEAASPSQYVDARAVLCQLLDVDPNFSFPQDGDDAPVPANKTAVLADDDRPVSKPIRPSSGVGFSQDVDHSKRNTH